MKTLRDQIASARRELALRRVVYPKRVSLGSMKASVASHETDCMTAIVATLERCLALQEMGEEMAAQWRAEHAPKDPPKRGDEFDLE